MPTALEKKKEEYERKKREKQQRKEDEKLLDTSTDTSAAPEAPKEEQRPAQIEIIRNQETGKISGARFPDGRTVLGSEKDIRDLISAGAEKSGLPIFEATTAAAERERIPRATEKAEGLTQTFEEQGVLAPLPEKVELSPEGRSDLPLFNLIRMQYDEWSIQAFKDFDNLEGMEDMIKRMPPEYQDLYTAQYVESEVDKINKVYSDRALLKIGQIVESIPVVGSLAERYADGLATPSGKAQDNLAALEAMGSEIENWNERATRNPEGALDTMIEFEKRINEYEEKIRLLILLSPRLQANPEQVDKIEEKIFGARTRISRVRETAGIAIIQGTSQQPLSIQEAFGILDNMRVQNERRKA